MGELEIIDLNHDTGQRNSTQPHSLGWYRKLNFSHLV